MPSRALSNEHRQTPPISHPEAAIDDEIGEEWEDVADVPVAPGQMEPYTLAPDTDRCLIKGCHFYGLESNNMREHMEKFHGWPSQDDIDFLKYQEQYSLPRGTKSCPKPDCKWHDIVKEHTWQVTEHMKLCHGWPRHKDFQQGDVKSGDDAAGPSHNDHNKTFAMQNDTLELRLSPSALNSKTAGKPVEAFRGPREPAKRVVQDQSPPASLKRTLDGYLKATVEPMEGLRPSPELVDRSSLSANFTRPLEETMPPTPESMIQTEKALHQAYASTLR